MAATPRTPPTLLTLPLETRIRIHEYVFAEAELRVIGLCGVLVDGVRAGVSYHNANRAMLLVSKQIRIEAKPVLLTQTVIIIQDGWRWMNKHRQGAKTAGPSASLPPALMNWVPPGQHEAYSKTKTVQLRISTGFAKFTLRWFSNLRVLEIKLESHSCSLAVYPGKDGPDDPPHLEKIAAELGRTMFQWAEEMVYGSAGGRKKLIERLKVPPSVELRTSIMKHTLRVAYRSDLEVRFVGVGLKKQSH